MQQSKLFTKTQKEIPADETAKNAKLLIQAGFAYKEMAGVYTLLPLGLRVLKKIENIIRDEMNQVGGIEMQTSVLQSKEVWEKTNRWSDEVVDNWFKTKLKNDTELGLSFTNEEAYTSLLKQYISSYKDLPIYTYDFKSIFRNEVRSKSGLMRGREFYWKALYSFSKNKVEHDEFYEKIKNVYQRIFNRVGIGENTYLTFASGGTFSKYSHEFQTISEAGEDIIYLDKRKNLAINQEVYNDEVLKELGINKSDVTEEKAIEVGNIFSLGEKFSKPLNLNYKTETGETELVYMGSYGIGLTRLMGTAVEVLSDEKGIVWPESISPFQIHLLTLFNNQDDESYKLSSEIYNKLLVKGVEVLWDDREGKSAGEKFNDADLIGITIRVIISAKSLENGGVEIKNRNEKESKVISIGEFLEKF